MIDQCTKDYVTTISGTRVYFKDPQPNQIKITDIIHHLAWTCRYNGHIKGWYSNAEHSVIGAFLSRDIRVRRYFIIHDAAEYVFGDMSSPVKRNCPEYRKLITNFQNYLYCHFLGDYDEPPEVHEIDQRLCASEMKYLRGNPDEDITCEPYPRELLHFQCLERIPAMGLYTGAFALLFPEYKDGV